ncbi:hypothetical protein MKJ04_04585 [Pontibacter sp. E15-1]|uniref:hypothetical protein n=1 Tax=Pontibacter sp. E15-1 TaxID=2919918 RepID=UPI001F4FA7C3|nr:hypothetical protein [Pontibacter sp. E15-1]MCJ8164107.1 hypothetical protein [Pontibacter sp. E15-1]
MLQVKKIKAEDGIVRYTAALPLQNALSKYLKSFVFCISSIRASLNFIFESEKGEVRTLDGRFVAQKMNFKHALNPSCATAPYT